MFFLPVQPLSFRQDTNPHQTGEQKDEIKTSSDKEDNRMSPVDSIQSLLLLSTVQVLAPPAPSSIEAEVLELFEQFRNPVFRYTLSFAISLHDAEEVVQDVFLALFRHLQMGKSRRNLRGWIFRVAHNLALKQRYAMLATRNRTVSDDGIVEIQIDQSPGPEERIFSLQRQYRLLAVVQALPEVDQHCLRLRAEGLRYREIATVVGISLGAVSISLTRALARLVRADGG